MALHVHTHTYMGERNSPVSFCGPELCEPVSHMEQDRTDHEPTSVGLRPSGTIRCHFPCVSPMPVGVVLRSLSEKAEALPWQSICTHIWCWVWFAYGGQNVFQNLFTPCTMYVPETELGSSGLVANTFTQWAISLTAPANNS